MADVAVGVTACVAFWRDLNFKAAVVIAASIFLLGDATGHIRQMLFVGNFAPGNAGLSFYTDIICPLLAIALLIAAKRRSSVLQTCEICTLDDPPRPLSDFRIRSAKLPFGIGRSG